MPNLALKKPKNELALFLDEEGISAQAFAQSIGASKRNVERWLDDETFPRMEQAQRIFIETGHRVGLLEWRTPYMQRKKAEASAKVLKGKRRLNPRQSTKNGE